MGRKLIMLAVMSLLITGVASAAVENIKVSGDITVQAIKRDLTLGSADGFLNTGNIAPGVPSYLGTTHGEEDNFLLSQVRLRFDADLTENVSGVIRLINERIWGMEQVEDTDVTIDLAYIELKEFLYQPLTLIVGRQNLYYGNGFIVGDPDTNMTYSQTNNMVGRLSRDVFGDLSLRKSFDAIRSIIDYSPYTIDIVMAKVSEGFLNEDSVDNADDITLSGINAAYQWASYNGITEAYFWYANNARAANYMLQPYEVPEDQSKTFVIGGRMQFDPNDNITLGLEGAYQFGDKPIFNTLASNIALWTGLFPLPGAGGVGPAPFNGTNQYQHLSAFAIQALGEYRFLNKYNAKLNLGYTYLSGEDDMNDDKFTAWDPMFEDQVPAEIMNILFPHSNAHFATVEGSMMPREDITVGLKYAFAKLAQKLDTQLNATDANCYFVPSIGNNIIGGSIGGLGYGPAEIFVYQVNRNNSYLGSEIDAYAIYDYTEDVQIRLTGAWFIPGDFFTDANDDLAYSFRASMKLDF